MTAPAPLTDLDLRHVPAMLLDVARFRDSDLAGEDPTIIGISLMLWACSWHQVPCASIPNDDKLLARYTGFGRDLDGWLALRERVLGHGWVLCSDNRLYHRVVAEKAIEIAAGGKVRSRKAKHAAVVRWAKQSSEHAPSMPAASTEHPLSNAHGTNQASTEHGPSNAASNANAMLGDAKVKESKVRERKENNQNPTQVEPVPRASHEPKAEAISDKRWVELRVHVITSLREANMLFDPEQPPNANPMVDDWQKLGVDPDKAKNVITRVVSQAASNHKKIGLSYIDTAVKGKHEEITAAAALAPSQVVSAPSAPVECEGHQPFAVEYSHGVLDMFERGAMFWAPQIGPRPDQRGCRIPMEVLRERGYRDEHNRVVPLGETVAGKRKIAAIQAREALIASQNGAVRPPEPPPKRSLAPRLKTLSVPPGETIQ